MIGTKNDINYPIIILEGGDGTGKTTLAEAIIAEYPNTQYLHCGYDTILQGHMVGYHLGVLSDAINLAEKGPVIIDRWRMSEVVYGDIYRDGPELESITQTMYQLALEAGSVFVFCHPEDREEYVNEFKRLEAERDEPYKKAGEVYDKYAKSIQEFLEVPTQSNVSYVYDRFQSTPQEQVQMVKFLIQKTRKA